MCADMSRIEWKKDKKGKTNKSKNTSVKGQRAKASDCNNATSFFNFLTQR